MAPHNLVLTCIGAALLWVGWFGFNAGSAVDRQRPGRHGDDGHAGRHRRGGAGLDVRRMGGARQADGARHLSGAVAGLVAITPASGFVSPIGSIVIGIVAGVVCY